MPMEVPLMRKVLQKTQRGVSRFLGFFFKKLGGMWGGGL